MAQWMKGSNSHHNSPRIRWVLSRCSFSSSSKTISTVCPLLSENIFKIRTPITIEFIDEWLPHQFSLSIFLRAFSGRLFHNRENLSRQIFLGSSYLWRLRPES